MDDEEIAELMNWLLRSFSSDQLPDPFEPYSGREVAELRIDPENDPEAARLEILSDIATRMPAVEAALANPGSGRR